jgi:acetyl esterase/lipase
MEDRSVLSRPARPADAECYFGDPARPTVLLIHGGFWRPEYDLTHLRPMASALSGLGWPVCLIEYPRVPGRPDLVTAGVATAVSAFAGREIVLMGHSAGGHLALWAAGLNTGAVLRGVIGLASVADLGLARSLNLDDGAVRDFLGPYDERDYQPVYDRPVLIHGTDDTLVPISVSEAYQGRHELARLVRVPEAGHFALIDPISDAWPIVIDELARLLA